MLMRIVLAITCSILAYAYSHLTNSRNRSSQLPDPRRRGRESKDGQKETIQSCTEVHTTQKEEQEEVKRVSTFSPASSCRSFQETDQLLLPEFDDLLSRGFDFHSESSIDDGNRSEEFSVLPDDNDNSKHENEEEHVKLVNVDDNFDPRKDESTSEDDEALNIFEALASSDQKDFHVDGKYIAGDEDCGLSIRDAHNTSELIQLRSLVMELQEKEVRLQAELLEYYGLKEQEKDYIDLERQLRKKNAEITKLNSKIDTLEAQKIILSQEVMEKDDIKKDLEAARVRIKDLQRQLHSDAGQTKAHLLVLKQQVAALQEKEQEASKHDFELEKKLQALQELEVEVVELRRMNKDLQHQRRELVVKLTAAEAKIAELSSITESDVVARAEAEALILKRANEDLNRQVEGLQMNRFSEVEELVYLRWVNACLRYELRNYKTPPGKLSALDLNRSLSPRSQERAKQLMLEFAGPDLLALRGKEQGEVDLENVSSRSSTPSEYCDFDDNSTEGASVRHSGSKKSGLIRKLKKWGRSKDDSHVSPRSSISDSKSISSKLSFGHGHGVTKGNLESILLRNSSDSVAITTYGTNDSDSLGKVSSSSSGLQHSLISESSQTGSDTSGRLSRTRTKSISNDMELTSGVAASFELMSKSVASDLDKKYPPFKDRHKLAVAREMAIKEKADQFRAEKLVEKVKVETPTTKQVFQALEKAKIDGSSRSEEVLEIKSRIEGRLKFSELEKRDPRVPRPPPKPSSSGSAADSKVNVPFTRPAPPPLPQSLLTSPGVVPPPPPPGMPLSQKLLTSPATPPPLSKVQHGARQKVQRSPEVVEFYQTLMKRETRKDSAKAGSAAVNLSVARNNMIGEIENRSTFLLAVKADVETQGEFVQSLATEVRAAAYTSIDDVVAFVTWLDEELSFLVDETAVLKHFEWPESKADALREAAFEYQDLKKLEKEMSSFEDDTKLPRDIALKKMLTLLEKVEQSIYALLRTRDMAVSRYKQFNIPTYWILDSGLVGKIKLASVQLARKYMKRVVLELDSIGMAPEKEPQREFLLLQGVRFAFRIHQFAGGFDEESMRAFEDLRSRVHAQSIQQRQEVKGRTS